MKDRLIQLLKKADEEAQNRCITDYDEAISANADFLLSEGVIVPPCKVGDRVFVISKHPKKEIQECRVSAFEFTTHDAVAIIDRILCGGFVIQRCRGIYLEEFGKTVFLTKEEADQKLKEIK